MRYAVFFATGLPSLALPLSSSFLFLAIFADLIAPYDYDDVDFTKVLLFPFEDPAHPLGTDELGRDFLSRLIYGARTSMIVGLTVMTIAVVIGVTLGGLAGYFGGKVDFVISRIHRHYDCFPRSALCHSAGYGGRRRGAQRYHRLEHHQLDRHCAIDTWSSSCHCVKKEFVEAARALGVPGRQIISSHLVPNSLSPLVGGGQLWHSGSHLW